MGGKSGLPMNMVPAENMTDDKSYYNVGERKLMDSATENNRLLAHATHSCYGGPVV